MMNKSDSKSDSGSNDSSAATDDASAAATTTTTTGNKYEDTKKMIIAKFRFWFHVVFWASVELTALFLSAVLSHTQVQQSASDIIVLAMNKFMDQPDIDERMVSVHTSLMKHQERLAHVAGTKVVGTIGSFLSGMIHPGKLMQQQQQQQQQGATSSSADDGGAVVSEEKRQKSTTKTPPNTPYAKRGTRPTEQQQDDNEDRSQHSTHNPPQQQQQLMTPDNNDNETATSTSPMSSSQRQRQSGSYLSNLMPNILLSSQRQPGPLDETTSTAITREESKRLLQASLLLQPSLLEKLQGNDNFVENSDAAVITPRTASGGGALTVTMPVQIQIIGAKHKWHQDDDKGVDASSSNAAVPVLPVLGQDNNPTQQQQQQQPHHHHALLHPPQQPYTVYIIKVTVPVESSNAAKAKGYSPRPGQRSCWCVEHRYSEFAQLHDLVKKHDVEGVYESPTIQFPGKHWLGRPLMWKTTTATAASGTTPATATATVKTSSTTSANNATYTNTGSDASHPRQESGPDPTTSAVKVSQPGTNAKVLFGHQDQYEELVHQRIAQLEKWLCHVLMVLQQQIAADRHDDGGAADGGPATPRHQASNDDNDRKTNNTMIILHAINAFLLLDRRVVHDEEGCAGGNDFGIPHTEAVMSLEEDSKQHKDCHLPDHRSNNEGHSRRSSSTDEQYEDCGPRDHAIGRQNETGTQQMHEAHEPQHDDHATTTTTTTSAVAAAAAAIVPSGDDRHTNHSDSNNNMLTAKTRHPPGVKQTSSSSDPDLCLTCSSTKEETDAVDDEREENVNAIIAS